MFLALCRGLGFIPPPCAFQGIVSCSHVFSMGKENESYPQDTLFFSTLWGVPFFPWKVSYTSESLATCDPAILSAFCWEDLYSI